MPNSGNSIGSDKLAILATIIAVALSKGLNLQQVNVFGNFWVSVGSIMLMIAAQDEAIKTRSEATETDTQQQLQDMQEQLKQLIKEKSSTGTVTCQMPRL